MPATSEYALFTGSPIDKANPPGNTNLWKKSREWADILAVVAHVATIVVACVVKRDGTHIVSDDVYIQLLVVMSAITAGFHVVYYHKLSKTGEEIEKSDPFPFGCNGNNRNTAKWLEYSITATLGTLSLAYSSGATPSWQIVVFLICVAVTEQFTGYTIDSAPDAVLKWTKLTASGKRKAPTSPFAWSIYRTYLTTFLCQIGEFIVLYEYKAGNNSAMFWYYVGAWSAFGFWAGARLVGLVTEIGPTELGYTWLSTIAKIGLFAAAIGQAVQVSP